MKKAYVWISSGFLILIHILMLVFIYRRMPALLDSDMSSEMVLGKLLAEENKPITDAWYYSTEIRVVNTQLLYAFFFKFTQNWKAVRMFATAILHLMLTGSVLYFGHRAGSGKQAPLMAVTLLLPLADYYFYIMLMGCYYIPCVVISFITIGLCMRHMEKPNLRLRIVSGILAFLAGLGGLRQIVVLYFPLLLCALLIGAVEIYRNGWAIYQKSKKVSALWFSLIGIVSSAVGYLINAKFFSERFYFKQWDKIHYTSLKIERISTLFHDMLGTLGYKSGELNFRNTLCNGISFCLMVLLIVSIIHGLRAKGNRYFLTVFFLCNTAVLMLLYGLTDMDYTARYNLPVMVFAFPLMIFELNTLHCGNAPKYTKQAVWVVLAGMVMISSCTTMQILREKYRTKTLPAVAEFLKTTDYQNGYATFWNANVLTELTNGVVDMYAWCASGDDGTKIQNVKSVNDLYRWLQKMEHFTEKPSGKVFILLSRKELEHCQFHTALIGEDLIYADDVYLVYGYENYEVMQNYLHQSAT